MAKVMSIRLVSLVILSPLVVSCSQPQKVQLNNYSPVEIDVLLGENSHKVAPGDNVRFSVGMYEDLAIVADGRHLDYEPAYWDLSYAHHTRCGWSSCRVIYMRFDSDYQIRIVKPEDREQAAVPDSQPAGFPLEPIAE